jgi:catechol 2,3-dioxygenase-like lactoylglutathione lyase family enzyme
MAIASAAGVRRNGRKEEFVIGGRNDRAYPTMVPSGAGSPNSRAARRSLALEARDRVRAERDRGEVSGVSTVDVRYMVDDVEASIAFYTRHLGFTLLSSAAPAFAEVILGDLRLLLSGPQSSAARPMPDGRQPGPGGWNRIHLLVEDLAAEVDRLRADGVRFRSDIVKGPGGHQIVLDDPSGNAIELFQPAH